MAKFTAVQMFEKHAAGRYPRRENKRSFDRQGDIDVIELNYRKTDVPTYRITQTCFSTFFQSITFTDKWRWFGNRIENKIRYVRSSSRRPYTRAFPFANLRDR